MKLHKHFPPHLAQLVFLDKNGEILNINSLDYDLFIWLIYKTHLRYKDDKSLVYEFTYGDIKETFKQTLNTNKIKESLEKIGELQILSNYYQSYGDKEMILTKPFEIEIIVADNGISYGFSVETTDEFMRWFDNPKPKVDVNYNIIYNLKPTMSKLLYLLLRDAYGAYTNIERYRNIKIDRLRHMMNVSNEYTTNSNFITQLKKSIKVINKYSDLTIKVKIEKEINLRSGVSDIIGVKFTINWDKDKLFKLRVKNKNSKKESLPTDEADTDVVKSNTALEYSFDDYLKSRVEEEFDKSYHSGVKNIDSFKCGIKNNLVKDGIKDEFEIYKLLSKEKENLKSKITDNQPYMIILRHIDEETYVYYFNNSFQLVDSYENTVVTKSKSDTLETIYDVLGDYYFDIQRCSSGDEFKVGRI